MARITVEDCLTRENNRFALVQLASKRTKQLLSGSRALTTESKGNKAVVTALREIAQGAVRFMTPEDEAIVREREERLKELGLDTAPPTPTAAADELFILPSNGAKDKNGTVHASDDDDSEDEEIEELPDESDDDDDDNEDEGDDEEEEGKDKVKKDEELDS